MESTFCFLMKFSPDVVDCMMRLRSMGICSVCFGRHCCIDIHWLNRCCLLTYIAKRLLQITVQCCSGNAIPADERMLPSLQNKTITQLCCLTILIQGTNERSTCNTQELFISYHTLDNNLRLEAQLFHS